MKAMVPDSPGQPLHYRSLADPTPGTGQVVVKVAACGVCRTDLHVVDGDLTEPRLPIIPGHEIVGRVEAMGAGVSHLTAAKDQFAHARMAVRTHHQQVGIEVREAGEELIADADARCG